ncbi:hypothetical protein AYI70_g6132 [Smittium culicis]|uniref:Uncharacterized protein n=1 Tax=Smittium culicis TaxID=133412 RepID=A0A1R1XRG1_9FUNG|nr:hypothetical protein AYI70_g6132 [Smittium culicis]
MVDRNKKNKKRFSISTANINDRAPNLSYSLKFKIPDSVFDFESQSASLTHYFLFSAELKPTDKSLFNRSDLVNVLKNSQHNSTLLITSPIINIDPERFPTPVFTNSYNDKRYNIESLRIPNLIQNPDLPFIRQDSSSPNIFTSY